MFDYGNSTAVGERARSPLVLEQLALDPSSLLTLPHAGEGTIKAELQREGQKLFGM